MVLMQSIGFLDTPPLWFDTIHNVMQFEFPQIPLGLIRTTPIPNNLRLGHQMEYVFKQLIEVSGVYDIMVYNLQIGERKRTIGEIDFILKKKTTNQLIHVELTYKFYIIDPAFDHPLKKLIGPNRKDTFMAKIGKIRDRQFPLLHTTVGATALQSLGIDHTDIDHQCCFKAQLFIPYRSKSINIRYIESVLYNWILGRLR